MKRLLLLALILVVSGVVWAAQNSPQNLITREDPATHWATNSTWGYATTWGTYCDTIDWEASTEEFDTTILVGNLDVSKYRRWGMSLVADSASDSLIDAGLDTAFFAVWGSNDGGKTFFRYGSALVAGDTILLEDTPGTAFLDRDDATPAVPYAPTVKVGVIYRGGNEDAAADMAVVWKWGFWGEFWKPGNE